MTKIDIEALKTKLRAKMEEAIEESLEELTPTRQKGVFRCRYLKGLELNILKHTHDIIEVAIFDITTRWRGVILTKQDVRNLIEDLTEMVSHDE